MKVEIHFLLGNPFVEILWGLHIGVKYYNYDMFQVTY